MKASDVIPVLVQKPQNPGGDGVNTGLYKRLGGSDGSSVGMGNIWLNSHTEVGILTDISKRADCLLTLDFKMPLRLHLHVGLPGPEGGTAYRNLSVGFCNELALWKLNLCTPAANITNFFQLFDV